MNENNNDAKIIYNITTQVNADVSEAWLQYILQVHLPAVMQTGCFEKYQVTKLLIESDDVVSFAIQFYALSVAQYNRYAGLYKPELEQQMYETWGSESVSFATLMEIID